MNLAEGIATLFAIAGAMVFFVGSLMIIKGVVQRYLVHESIERWKQRA